MGVILVAHNSGSAQRLLDAARIAYALDVVELFIASKPYGSAAQSGVPEAQKMALKTGKSFAVLPDIRDVIELLGGNRPIYTVSRDYGERVYPEELDLEDAIIIIGMTEPGLTKQEAFLGKPIYPAGIKKPLGPIAEAAILLYFATRKSSGNS